MKRLSVLSISAGFAVLALAFTAADWPQWRGPNRDGVSSEKGLLKSWPEGGPKLLWQSTELGQGYGSPAVVGDKLYVMGSKGMDNEFVQLLNVADGYRSELWPSANTLPFARTRRKRLTILAYAYKVTHIQEIVRQLEEYKRALDSAIDALQGREGARKLTSRYIGLKAATDRAMRRYWARRRQFQAVADQFQDVPDRDPIHAGGLHRYVLDAVLFQPVAQTL